MKRVMMPLLLVIGLLGTLIVSAVVVPYTAAYTPASSLTTTIIVAEPLTPTWDSAVPQVAESTAIYLPVVCNGTFSMPTPTLISTPGNAITYPTALPVPVVVEQSPAHNEEINPDGSIKMVFDRAMDQASVESAFAMVASTDALNTADTTQANGQSVIGTFAWKNERTLVFTPKTVLERGMTYAVVVDETAHASDGTPIGKQFATHITTAGYLAINEMIPAPQADNIALDNVIMVMFNRPVVPLQTVNNNNNDLPQPLSFSPAIEGTGEWLNTSIYVFRPTVPLITNTQYTVIIDPSLTDVTGNPLQQAYHWQFTTVPPTPVEVEYSVPQANDTNVSLEPMIRVYFNQSVNRDSAITAMQLLDAKGSLVQGIATLIGETLVFTPSQRLAYNTTYRVIVQAGVTSAEDGSPLAQPYECPFTTVPMPHVITASPRDGEQHVPPYSHFSIQFNAPVNPDSIISHLEITPPISSTQVYSYFSSYNNTFYVVMNMQPTTNYTVHIMPGIADPYGSTTTEDMRIQFRTNDLEPEASLVVPGTIATYSVYTPQHILLRTLNVRAATLQLYQLPANALRDNNLNENSDTLPTGAQLIRHWQVPLNVPRNTKTDTAVYLTEDASPLAPGIYMLTLDQPSSSYPQRHILVVSSLHLTLKASERDALVWANDGQTGIPTPNLPIAFYDQYGTPLGTATTDSDGIAQIVIDRTTNNGVIAMTETDTGAPFAATSGLWSYGVSPTSFNVLQDYDIPEMNLYLYTDRGIYRPGQTVAFKGIVRNEDDVQYSLPGALNATVKAYNEWDEQVYEQHMVLNEYGTLSGEVALPDTARLGTYRISLHLGNNDKTIAMTQFVVAAYRAPEFGVEVVPAQPDVVQDSPIQATVAVSYFFGLPVQDAAVQWRVTATNYTPPQNNTTRLSYNDVVDDVQRCWYCWWIPTPPPDVIATGEGRTDANGNVHITLPSLLKNSSGITITKSTRLEIEATVIGADNQAVSNRASIVRHASDVYVGIASRQSFGVVDKEQVIDVVAVDTHNVPIAEQDITIVVDKTQWEDIYIPQEQQWQWELTRTSVFTRVVTTDARGAASIHFTPTTGGNYLLIATTHDSANREVAASNDLWIASDEYVSWWHTTTDRITLLSDTTAYTVGDTASILIPSPFQQPHWALITIERGGILQHDVRRMQSNSMIYELPITSEYVPNIYVSVVLVAAPYTDAVYGVYVPAEYKVGILPLTIAPDPQTLTVSVKPESNQTRPGDTIHYKVHVTDNAGTPVAAELSLDLVDKAVLTLKPRQAQAIRTAFYAMRGLGVVTASSLAISAERLLHEEPSDDDKDRDGDGDLDVDVEVPLTPTMVPVEDEPPQNSPGDGDATAKESSPGVSVRQEFQDTAYWQAHVETDDDGAVGVNVPLPDNITTWVMRAIAVTKDTRVGEATADIITSKPVLIRPVTPRFFVMGDKATIAANVSNGTDTPLTTHVWLTTSGITVTSALTQTLVVPAGGEAKARWHVVVGDVAAVDVTFFAAAGDYRDASKPRLTTAPNNMLAVYRYIAPETVGTAGMLATGESRTEVIALPPRLDDSKGHLTVKLSPSLAASMQESLRYLEHYEHECTEQVVSRFLPNILTLQALKRLGIARPALETHLQSLVQQGMNKLEVRQNGDGGWGWWYGRSRPFVSGYVMFGLWQAQQAGFVVNEHMMERGTEYLAMVVSGNFDTSYDDYNSTRINQRAWLLYVCTLLLDNVDGASDDAMMMSSVTDILYDDRHQMQLFAQAFLALSMHQQNPHDERIATLLAHIKSNAIVSATGVHWEEQYHDWWSMNTNTRTTAIILSMMTQLDPPNALTPHVVRWLMVAREGDAWQTTQETAWALIGLTNWMVVTGELNADYDYAVWLYEPHASRQDTPPPLLSGHISSSDVLTSVVVQRDVATLLATTSNWLTIGRSNGTGMLYYTAHLNAYMPVEYISALSRGMHVQRRYTLASCAEGAACPTIDTVKVGDVVRVEVSLMAPNQLYYVLLEDPIPAGTEIVDAALATTARSNDDDEQCYPSGSSWYAWWWHWQWYAHKEFRDEKVVLFANALSRGTYTYSYNVQATTPGEFRVIPTTANEMYFPEVQARGNGQLFNVVE